MKKLLLLVVILTIIFVSVSNAQEPTSESWVYLPTVIKGSDSPPERPPARPSAVDKGTIYGWTWLTHGSLTMPWTYDVIVLVRDSEGEVVDVQVVNGDYKFDGLPLSGNPYTLVAFTWLPLEPPDLYGQDVVGIFVTPQGTHVNVVMADSWIPWIVKE